MLPYDEMYYKEAAGEKVEDDSPPSMFTTVSDTLSGAEVPLDYSELIAKEAFQGEYTIEAILEGLENQFNNYIDLEDQTDYVDVFYSQMEESRKIERYEDEEHPQEIKEALDSIEIAFIDAIRELFHRRLTISIAELEAGSTPPDLEYMIRILYEFFILRAKENFMTVITKDILSSIHTVITDDDKFFDKVRDMLRMYSPLVIAMGPMEFIQATGNEEVYELFEKGKVLGNFLRKWSPQLYKHEDFEVEIINNIVLEEDIKQEEKEEYERTPDD